jgi:malate synthase
MAGEPLVRVSSPSVVNTAPFAYELENESPEFAAFYRRLHSVFTPLQRQLCAKRAHVLQRAHRGDLPQHLPPSVATDTEWHVDLPAWCVDQRNLMSCPADDVSLVAKGIRSQAPVVLLDLEDSVSNTWSNITKGTENIVAALQGALPGVGRGEAALFVRVRGLHIGQAGVIPGETTSASLFDLARIWYQLDPAALRHPFAVSIPKSESAEEALWWRDVFTTLASSKNLPSNYIRCMAIDESHPLAYQLEEFTYNLRDHIVGLTLGRLDYMASLIDFNLSDPAWVLPDRNTIPHDVGFYQQLRQLLVEISHKHGMLAIGGMTAVFPDRNDAVHSAKALQILEQDKRNEASYLMDGAWTGHPDQNEIAKRQFPFPNQGFARRNTPRHPDLRVPPVGIGKRTVDGTRAAISSILRYRYSVACGKGAVRIDGYMEDMATERIYRIMIAQRIRHRNDVAIYDGDRRVVHSHEFVEQLFAEELQKVLATLPAQMNVVAIERYREAARILQEAIFNEQFDAL